MKLRRMTMDEVVNTYNKYYYTICHSIIKPTTTSQLSMTTKNDEGEEEEEEEIL